MPEWVTLESHRFTSSAAFVREILALLESTDYRFKLLIRPGEMERLTAELENQRTLGRVKVRMWEKPDGD